MHTRFQWGDLRKRERLEDLGMDRSKNGFSRCGIWRGGGHGLD